ncbi:hypothetical protein C0J52_23860, partial [Blattella germanica]
VSKCFIIHNNDNLKVISFPLLVRNQIVIFFFWLIVEICHNILNYIHLSMCHNLYLPIFIIFLLLLLLELLWLQTNMVTDQHLVTD